MRVLGKNSDDKGAQLEALVAKALAAEGFTAIVSNLVSAGGNELDVTAERLLSVLGEQTVVPVLCEAKAYKDPVNMPTWQKFLGKVFLGRKNDSNLIGILVALSGVNGNVAGSYKDLKTKDNAVMVIDGDALVAMLVATGDLTSELTVRAALASNPHGLSPVGVEAAYYGGGAFWIVSFVDGTYEVLSATGGVLSSVEIEQLRPALEATVAGTLILADEAAAVLERRRWARVGLLVKMLNGEQVAPEEEGDAAEAFSWLSAQAFTKSTGDAMLILYPADSLSTEDLCALINVFVDGPLRLEDLSFLKSDFYRPYVLRLVELMSDIQAGFELPGEQRHALEALVPAFPSVWKLLANPIEPITVHRTQEPALDISEDLDLLDVNTFWEAVASAVQGGINNPWYRGVLYDEMHIAEIHRRNQYIVKSKTAEVANFMVEQRLGLRQLAPGWSDPVGSKYILMTILLTAPEPWEEEHPAPIFDNSNVADVTESDSEE